MISPQSIERIREAVSLADFLSSTAELKRSGRIYKGLCPFHKEKTPSFVVYPDQNRFHCFGCGKSGDIFTYLQEIEGLSFVEAVEKMGAVAGVPLEKDEQKSDYARAAFDKTVRLNREAVDYFQFNLFSNPAGTNALSYLKRRGVQIETAELFHLGYAVAEWDALFRAMISKSWKVETLLEAGLVRRSKDGRRVYDYFRDRLVFPIYNAKGDPVGFGGRILVEGDPKYLNSSESAQFQKRKTLYGFHLARGAINRTNVAYITEGYLDVIGLHQLGIANTVAPLGTSLTEDHLKMLKNITNRLVFMFDGDSAGRKAVLRTAAEVMKNGFQAKVVMFPAGQDPFDIAVQRGAEAIFKLVKQGLPLTDFVLNEIYRDTPPRNTDATIQFLYRVFDFALTLNEPVIVELILRKAALLSNVEVQTVAVDYENYSRGKKRKILQNSHSVTNIKGGVSDKVKYSEKGTEFYLTRLVGLHSPLYHDFEKLLGQYGGLIDPAARILHELIKNLFRNNPAWTAEQFVDAVSDPGLKAIVREDSVSGRLNDQWKKQFAESSLRFKIEKIRKERLELAEEIKRCNYSGEIDRIDLLQKRVLELRRQEESLRESKESG